MTRPADAIKFQVINETVRLANIVPGIFRKALQDVQINGTFASSSSFLYFDNVGISEVYGPTGLIPPGRGQLSPVHLHSMKKF